MSTPRIGGLSGALASIALAVTVCGGTATAETRPAVVPAGSISEFARENAGITLETGGQSVIFEQLPAEDRGGGQTVLFNTAPPDAQNGFNIHAFETADDFTLAAPAQIDAIRFWIISFSGTSQSLTYRVHADAGGTPGPVIASGSISTSTYAQTGQFPFGFPQMIVEGDFVPPITLPAGTYWLSPHVVGGCDSGEFWETGSPFGNTARQSGAQQCGTIPFSNLGVDLAFTLFNGPFGSDPCDDDTVPPIILDCPGDFTTTCNTEGGFNLEYTPAVDESCPYGVEYSWTNPLPFGENEVTVTVTDQAGNSDACTFTVTVVPDPKDPFRGYSQATYDGTVRESDLIGGVEGPVYPKYTTFDIGDDAANWGRRGIISFDTASIPDDAVVTGARIRLTRTTTAGNPAALGTLHLDMGGSGGIARGGTGAIIGSSAALEPTDYDDAAASLLDIATSFPYPAANNYTVFAEIDPAAATGIDKTGLTQFRVRFATESDDDNVADFISFASGEGTAVTRPELIVEFFAQSCQPCPTAAPCGAPTVVTLWSTPSEDGGLMEAHFTADVGGTANTGATTSPVGDMSSRQQLQVLLNFDTSSIPADATIDSAELRVYRASATGSWSSFGPIWVGMRNPCAMPWWYGASGALELADFQAINSAAPVATLTVPASNTYTSALLNAAGLAAINRGGMTQMKLYYPTPDDGDAVADQVQIATGNYGAISPGRPRLVVTYTTGCGGDD